MVNQMKPAIVVTVLMLASTVLTACHNLNHGLRNSPPSHAPAYGRDHHYSYLFYPSLDVYYDSGRGMYFYLSDNIWISKTHLPSHLKVKLGHHVTIDMDHENPYTQHNSHKKKYAPGQARNGNGHPGKGQGKGKGKKW